MHDRALSIENRAVVVGRKEKIKETNEVLRTDGGWCNDAPDGSVTVGACQQPAAASCDQTTTRCISFVALFVISHRLRPFRLRWFQMALLEIDGNQSFEKVLQKEFNHDFIPTILFSFWWSILLTRRYQKGTLNRFETNWTKYLAEIIIITYLNFIFKRNFTSPPMLDCAPCRSILYKVFQKFRSGIIS